MSSAVAVSPREHGLALLAHRRGEHAVPVAGCEHCRFPPGGPLARVQLYQVDPVALRRTSVAIKERKQREVREFWRRVRQAPEGVPFTAWVGLGECADGCGIHLNVTYSVVRRGESFYVPEHDPERGWE